MKRARLIILTFLLITCLLILSITFLGQSGPLTFPAQSCLKELKTNSFIMNLEEVNNWINQNKIEVSQPNIFSNNTSTYIFSHASLKNCSTLENELKIRIEKPEEIIGTETILNKIGIQNSTSPQSIFVGELDSKYTGNFKQKQGWFKFLGFKNTNGINYEKWNY